MSVPAVDARAALADVSGVGGFFTVDTDTAPGRGDDWRPLHSLWTDDAALADRLAVVRSRLAAFAELPTERVEPRVAASILYQGLAARLLAPAVGTAVLHGVVVPVAGLCWRPAESGPLPLRLRAGHAPVSGDPVGMLRDLVLGDALAPLAAALRGRVKVAPGLLWGNAASALGGAVRELGWARPHAAEPAVALGTALLAEGPLKWTGRFVRPWNNRPATFFVRRTCCLYYRLPAGGKCGDCALLDPATRRSQWAAATER